MFSKRRKRFIEAARQQAEKSVFPKFRHGAVLVKGGSIISSSENKNQFSSFATRFVEHNGHGTVHAELGCILGIDKSKTKNAVIYVVRLNNASELQNSRPCDMCSACLAFVGVRGVYYSISENEFGFMKI